jgi:hypothetical protein
VPRHIVLKYAEEHPEEVLLAIDDRTDALIRELEAQHREARRSLRRRPPRPRYTPERLERGAVLKLPEKSAGGALAPAPGATVVDAIVMASAAARGGGGLHLEPRRPVGKQLTRCVPRASLKLGGSWR